MKEYKITKERLKAMAEECPEAEGILKKEFPEAFEGGWKNVSEEIKWGFRTDFNGFGVITMTHKSLFIGHIWIDGEFYFTDKDYKREMRCKNFCILKQRSK